VEVGRHPVGTLAIVAMTLAIAHSRGWLDHEERVAAYWPEFALHGKGNITVRQLLAHQAGLFAFDGPVDRGVVAGLRPAGGGHGA
jgi:CubicO group peptidase (beta-lactamase class C family)